MADYGPTGLHQKACTPKRPSRVPWRIKHSHVVMIVTCGLSPFSWPRLRVPKGWERADKSLYLRTCCTSLSHAPPTSLAFLFPPRILIALLTCKRELYPSDTMCFLLPGAWGTSTGAPTKQPLQALRDPFCSGWSISFPKSISPGFWNLNWLSREFSGFGLHLS